MLLKTILAFQVKLVTCILALFTLLLSCTPTKKLSSQKSCSTKYPVILVHGFGFRDDFPIIKYWSKIPKVLRKNGATVYLANTDAYNCHVENALTLRDKVLMVLDETNSKKVNLICHSKGGIESRYMISKLRMADKVASLTTLACPHRGTFIADTALSRFKENGKLPIVIGLFNKYARIIGDKNPNVLQAIKSVTTNQMKDFNLSVPDSRKVYYQSYGSVITNDYPSLKIRLENKIMQKAEGDNDAIVSITSCQWGNFKGIVSSNQDFGVSHWDIIGMRFVSKQSTFDAEGFIVGIVEDLKMRGF